MADSVVCTYVPSERVPKRKEGEEEEGRKLEDGEEATAAAVEEESEISASLSLSLSLSRSLTPYSPNRASVFDKQTAPSASHAEGLVGLESVGRK